jgi:hypothetical protein
LRPKPAINAGRPADARTAAVLYERAWKVDRRNADAIVAYSLMNFAVGNLARTEAMREEAPRLDPHGDAALVAKHQELLNHDRTRWSADAQFHGSASGFVYS